MKKIGPQDYKTLFTEMPAGAEILDELTRRFGRAIYVQGGHEADRESCYRAGQRSVLDFILMQLNRADGVTDDVED